MGVDTDEVLALYLETGSYQETADRIGLGYEAVRKRVRRNLPPGSSTLFGAEGEQKLQWLRMPREALSTDEVASQVRQALFGYKPPKRLKTALKGSADLLCLWPLPDLHVGMRAWGKETGGADWDLAIANRVYRESMSELALLTPMTKHAIILVLGDLMHSDNYQYQTTNPATHHVVDQDGRYPKVLVAATDICMYSVDIALQRAETVEVVVLPGNHDGQSAIAIALALEMAFKSVKRVKVHMTPGRHWFFEFGSVMLAATHGDKCKPKDMPGLMAACQPEMWGRTKHRIVFCGHLHHEEAKAYPGCKVETLAAPCPQDSWTAEMGYHSARNLQTRIFHREKGERFKQIVGIV